MNPEMRGDTMREVGSEVDCRRFSFRGKIRIFQPAVPEYRVALFNGLGKAYSGRVEVWAGPMATGGPSFSLEHAKEDYAHQFKRIGPLVWQRGLSLEGLEKGDVIVVCGDVHQISSIWMAILAKTKGIGVVWWGHHLTSTSSKIGAWVRLKIAKRLADVMLCYTREGIDYLVNAGFDRNRVFATENTIDHVPILKAIDYWRDRLRGFIREHGLAGYDPIVFCGMFRPKARMDVLIKALCDKRLEKVVLVAIGDGEMSEEYHRVAHEVGVEDRVKWAGQLRSQFDLAPWFMTARAFVYPGPIGLGILHAFFYGLPVITHGNKRHQMPEFEAMEEGVTGLLFNENDPADLADKICRLLSDKQMWESMSDATRKIAFSRYSMDKMVANFSNAVEKAGYLRL